MSLKSPRGQWVKLEIKAQQSKAQQNLVQILWDILLIYLPITILIGNNLIF